MGFAGLEGLVLSKEHRHDFIELLVETGTGPLGLLMRLNPKAKKGEDMSWWRLIQITGGKLSHCYSMGSE